MGKGDKRSKKGKITISSYGVSRPRKSNKVVAAVSAVKAEPKVKKEKTDTKAAKPAAVKKTVKKKTEE